MKSIYASVALAILCFFVIQSCSKGTDAPKPTTQAPDALAYNPNTLELTLGSAGTSSNPSVQGTTPFTFALVSVTPANNAITLTSQGVVSVASTSPEGTFAVSITATNSVGNKIFNNVFTVIVKKQDTNTAGKVLFKDVVGIFSSNCANSCHNWTNYSQAKANIDNILTRVQLPTGSPSFMPQGGSRLGAADIALLAKWKADGLLQ